MGNTKVILLTAEMRSATVEGKKHEWYSWFNILGGDMGLNESCRFNEKEQQDSADRIKKVLDEEITRN